MLTGVLAFARQEEHCISPVGLGELLGHFFAQINLPLYYLFDAVYEFERRVPQDEVQFLPDDCLAECFWSNDQRRYWQRTPPLI